MVPRVQQYLQDEGAVSVLHVSEEYFKVGRVKAQYKLFFSGCTIILSPRFSEVLFSRGRHSKWPMSVLTFWDNGFFLFQKNLKQLSTVHRSFHCFECLCSNYLSTVAAQHHSETLD